MIKILNKTYIFLIFIIVLILLLYLPTLSFSPEGDDFLLLWHIRVPVSFLNVPFYGWEEPVAGRFGYGEAWYATGIFRIFGYQPEVFNFFGIITKIIASISVYIFTKKTTKNKTLASLSAFIFVFLSTGLNGETSFALHFSLLFLSIFLISSALFLEGIELKNFKNTVLGSIFLLVGNYLYTIRAFGIILLPVWIILRFKLLDSVKQKFISLIISIIIVLLSVLMVAKFIPGASSYASKTLLENSQTVFKNVQNGNYEYIRTILVSISFMSIPRDFYAVVDQIFNAGGSTEHFLKIGASFIWSLMFLTFIFPLYLLKLINKYQLGISYITGIVWNLILLSFTKKGIPLFYGGEVTAVTLGLYILLIGIILGLFYYKSKPAIGSTLLGSIAAAVLFYIPNWLHDPVTVSLTEGRYMTVSSGFVAIYLSILIYLAFKQSIGFGQKKKSHFRIIFIFLAVTFTTIILASHFQNLQKYIFDNKDVRRIDIVSAHRNFVKSKVDFSKRPLIVVVWTSADIYNAKREFFRHQSLGLIGDVQWDYKLTDQLKLFYSYEESMNAICDWRRYGINFDLNNFYEFHLTADRTIIDWSDKGREQLKTWGNFCQDKVKGVEVGISN